MPQSLARDNHQIAQGGIAAQRRGVAPTPSPSQRARDASLALSSIGVLGDPPIAAILL
jgi:hypothetical protein